MASQGLPATTSHTLPYRGWHDNYSVVTDAPSLNPDEVAALSKYHNLPVRKVGQNVKKEDNPVIYIDLPEEAEASGWRNLPDPSGSSKDEDPTPVVYIDIPEGNGSDVSQRVEEEQEPQYVQETIFYDPFNDRRIDMNKTQSKEAESDRDSITSDASDPPPQPRPWPPRPLPPNSLNLSSPGSSSGYAANTGSSSHVPAFMSKETYIYGRQPTPDDGFPLSPIPVTEFPVPPPAYEEIDKAASPNVVQEQPRPASPPRTQVIVPGSVPGVVGMPHASRKFLDCHHCGSQVHTLVVRETGALTHFLAWFMMLCCLFPCTICIYCTRVFKYKNHYCPNCNKKIGYEIPFMCMDMTYVTDT